MNVMFMSLGYFKDLNDSSVHLDILKRFAEDHDVWLVCKNEGEDTQLTQELGIHVLRVRTGKLKKIGLIQKGINTLLVGAQFKDAIKKYLSDVRFNLILYTTPPITFASAVEYVKKRDNAVTYLLLKDIFPQNAVDIGMLHTNGVKGLIYRYFRKMERQLYRMSDYIGCMSIANCEYVLRNNPDVPAERVEVCPNSINPRTLDITEEEKTRIRKEYGLPLGKPIFVYGGNLGKPQGIPFLIECMKKKSDDSRVFFLIVGEGTEYDSIYKYIDKEQPSNVKLIDRLPKSEYDTMICACDVGMIFLDHRFTIPNIPARTLSYMQAKIPVFALTDMNTDLGSIIENGKFGWWCESKNSREFAEKVDEIICCDTKKMGENGFKFLKENYTTDRSYSVIMKHFS